MNMIGKLGWIFALILGIGLGAMSYTFLIRGNVEPHADGRTAVLLLPDERNRVLAEMRLLLESVQAVVIAAVDGDMEAITATATIVGMEATRNESPQLIGKLPIEFKTLGFATHQAFDDLALTATVTDDPMVIFEELGTIMNNCTGCHASYRLGIEGADKEE